MYNCKYCNKECKNKNSLAQHEIRCKKNPNKLDMSYIKPGHSKGHIGTNQFIKAKQLGLEIPKVSDETKEKIAKIWRGKKHTQEQIEKIKKSMHNAVLTHPESYYGVNTNTRVKKYKYKDVFLDGSWELSFAKYLDNNNISWIRPKKGIKYIWNNEVHFYFPDFYLTDFKVYVEIKGRQLDRDLCKWKELSNLIVLRQDDINKIRNNEFNINDLINTSNI